MANRRRRTFKEIIDLLITDSSEAIRSSREIRPTLAGKGDAADPFFVGMKTLYTVVKYRPRITRDFLLGVKAAAERALIAHTEANINEPQKKRRRHLWLKKK